MRQPIISESIVKGWLTKDHGLLQYQEWIKYQLEPLAAIATTLEVLHQNWDNWRLAYNLSIIHAFIVQAVALFNTHAHTGNPWLVSHNIIRITYAIQCLLKLYPSEQIKEIKLSSPGAQLELNILFQRFLHKDIKYSESNFGLDRDFFDPYLVFDLLKILTEYQLLPMAKLVSMIESISLFVKYNFFLTSGYDQASGEMANFDWNNYIAWIKTHILLKYSHLDGDLADRMLYALTTLAINQNLNILLDADLINELLTVLTKEPRNIDLVTKSVNKVQILFNKFCIFDQAKLDINLLSSLWMECQSHESFEAPYIYLVSKIAEIFEKITLAGSAPPNLKNKFLEKILNYAKGKSAEVAGMALLSVGYILQSSQDEKEAIKLHPQLLEILQNFNKKDSTSDLRLKDIARILYALVLPPQKSWLKVKNTDHLVDQFLHKSRKLLENIVEREQELIYIQQFAEYYCLAKINKTLPECLRKQLLLRQPSIKLGELQHQFYNFLKNQTWFKQQYDSLAEEVLFNDQFAFVDIAFQEQRSKRWIIIEVDGYHHRQRIHQDARRDQYLRELKDDKGHFLVKNIIRIPIHINSTVEEMAVYCQKNLASFEEKINITKPSPLIETLPLSQPLPTQTPQSSHTLLSGKTRINIHSVDLKLSELKKTDLEILSAGIKAGKMAATRKFFHNNHSRMSNFDKASLLILAVQQEKSKINIDILRYLVDNVNLKIIHYQDNRLTRSALFSAIDCSNDQALIIFIKKAQGKLTSKDSTIWAEWQAALELARKNNQSVIIELLEKAGVNDSVKPKDKVSSLFAEYKVNLSFIDLIESQDVGKDHKRTCTDDYYMKIDTDLGDLGINFSPQFGIKPIMENIIDLAEKGNAKLQFYCYKEYMRSSLDHPENIEKSIYWLIRSAEQDFALAQFILGVYISGGYFLKKNREKCLQLLQKAADQNLAIAQFCFAKISKLIEKDHRKAFSYYIKSANQGLSAAQYHLAYCYDNGEGVEKNEKESLKWLILAAKLGFANANFILGLKFETGKGVDSKDMRRALDYYKKAADQGISDAQLSVGKFYQKGIWVKQDLKQAVKYYKMASDNGNVEANFKLSSMYVSNFYGQKDEKKAVEYLKKAASQGHMTAQCNMGIAYEKGLFSLQKNPHESCKFYKLVLSNSEKKFLEKTDLESIKKKKSSIKEKTNKKTKAKSNYQGKMDTDREMVRPPLLEAICKNEMEVIKNLSKKMKTEQIITSLFEIAVYSDHFEVYRNGFFYLLGNKNFLPLKMILDSISPFDKIELMSYKMSSELDSEDDFNASMLFFATVSESFEFIDVLMSGFTCPDYRVRAILVSTAFSETNYIFDNTHALFAAVILEKVDLIKALVKNIDGIRKVQIICERLEYSPSDLLKYFYPRLESKSWHMFETTLLYLFKFNLKDLLLILLENQEDCIKRVFEYVHNKSIEMAEWVRECYNYSPEVWCARFMEKELYRKLLFDFLDYMGVDTDLFSEVIDSFNDPSLVCYVYKFFLKWEHDLVELKKSSLNQFNETLNIVTSEIVKALKEEKMPTNFAAIFEGLPSSSSSLSSMSSTASLRFFGSQNTDLTSTTTSSVFKPLNEMGTIGKFST